MSPHGSIRVLLAKPGLDVHDRGIRVIARACRDAGMEVVYLGVGLYTAAQIAAIAAQEEVDVIGLSIMTGQPSCIASEVLDALRAQNAAIPIVLGGVIRDGERERLAALGIAAVFAAGASLDQITAEIRSVAKEREGSRHVG